MVGALHHVQGLVGVGDGVEHAVAVAGRTCVVGGVRNHEQGHRGRATGDDRVAPGVTSVTSWVGTIISSNFSPIFALSASSLIKPATLFSKLECD